MQGYGTMASKPMNSFMKNGWDRPTHVFVQAGVGSLADAVTGYFANRYPENPPKVVVVEAQEAACLYKGAVAGDGNIQAIVDGDRPQFRPVLPAANRIILFPGKSPKIITVFAACPDWGRCPRDART